MENILATVLLTIPVLLIVLLGMAIKVFLTPQGEFKGGCASNNPMFRDKVGACGVCGKTDFEDDEVCDEESSELPAIG